MLIKPLYGLRDAGKYWGVTLDQHLVINLGTRPVSGDSFPSLHVKRFSNTLEGVTISHVDNCLNDGTIEFEKLTELMLFKFGFKPRVYDYFEFYGTQVATIDECTVLLRQKYYALNIIYALKDCSLEEFCRYRALFSCLCHTRPELACFASRLSQVTDETSSQENLNELNKRYEELNRNLS